MARSRAALAALSILLGGGALGVAAESLTNPFQGDAAAISEGRRTYRQRCYICHHRQGGRGPNLFATKLSDEAFLLTVINGRKGATMPAFGLQLTPDQVWQVHAYVKSTDHYE
jgi:mono/diheme cytochrome c family protein